MTFSAALSRRDGAAPVPQEGGVIRSPLQDPAAIDVLQSVYEQIGFVLEAAKRQPARDDLDLSTIRGDLVMHPARRTASWRGIEVRLTYSEFEIVQALVSRPGIIVTRDRLLDVLGDDGERPDRAIDSHIKRIRRKFCAVDGEFDAIRTEQKIGYMWRAA